jgi:hypothetical protein
LNQLLVSAMTSRCLTGSNRRPSERDRAMLAERVFLGMSARSPTGDDITVCELSVASRTDVTARELLAAPLLTVAQCCVIFRSMQCSRNQLTSLYSAKLVKFRSNKQATCYNPC